MLPTGSAIWLCNIWQSKKKLPVHTLFNFWQSNKKKLPARTICTIWQGKKKKKSCPLVPFSLSGKVKQKQKWPARTICTIWQS